MSVAQAKSPRRQRNALFARLGAVAAVGMLALSLTGSADANRRADTYSLRGGAVPAGLKLEETGVFDMKNMQMTIDMGAQKQTVSMSVSLDRKVETEITDASERDVTGVLVTIEKQTADIDVNAGGQSNKQQEKSKLVGKELKGTKKADGTWEFEPSRGSLNAEEKEELDSVNGFDQNDELLPAEAVEVGHGWSTKGEDLEDLLRSMGGAGVEAIKSVKGQAKGEFVRIEQIDGVDCAIIEIDMDITADAEFEGQPAEIKVDAKLEFARRLDYGINVRMEATGKIGVEASMTQGEMKMSMKMSGPIKMETETKVTEPK